MSKNQQQNVAMQKLMNALRAELLVNEDMEEGFITVVDVGSGSAVTFKIIAESED